MQAPFKVSKSIPGTFLPINDGIYQGTWLGTRVTIPFDTFDINFQVEHNIGTKVRKVFIQVTDGAANVEETF